MRVKKESKQDLARALHPKYLKAGRTDKGRILNEFVEVTGYNRNYAKHLLLHGPPVPSGRVDRLTGTRRHAGGRPTIYSGTVVQALCVVAVPKLQAGYAASVWWGCCLSLWQLLSRKVRSLCLPVNEKLFSQ